MIPGIKLDQTGRSLEFVVVRSNLSFFLVAIFNYLVVVAAMTDGAKGFTSSCVKRSMAPDPREWKSRT